MYKLNSFSNSEFYRCVIDWPWILLCFFALIFGLLDFLKSDEFAQFFICSKVLESHLWFSPFLTKLQLCTTKVEFHPRYLMGASWDWYKSGRKVFSFFYPILQLLENNFGTDWGISKNFAFVLRRLRIAFYILTKRIRKTTGFMSLQVNCWEIIRRNQNAKWIFWTKLAGRKCKKWTALLNSAYSN